MYVRADGSAVVGSVQFPPGHLRDHAGVEISDAPTPEELEEHRPALEEHTCANLAISEHGTRLELACGALRTITTKGGTYAVMEFRVTGPSRPLPRHLTVDATGLVEADHHLQILLMVPTEVGWGRFRHRVRDDYQLDHQHTNRGIVVRAPTFGEDLTGTMRELTRRGIKRLGRAPDRAA